MWTTQSQNKRSCMCVQARQRCSMLLCVSAPVRVSQLLIEVNGVMPPGACFETSRVSKSCSLGRILREGCTFAQTCTTFRLPGLIWCEGSHLTATTSEINLSWWLWVSGFDHKTMGTKGGRRAGRPKTERGKEEKQTDESTPAITGHFGGLSGWFARLKISCVQERSEPDLCLRKQNQEINK